MPLAKSTPTAPSSMDLATSFPFFTDVGIEKLLKRWKSEKIRLFYFTKILFADCTKR